MVPIYHLRRSLTVTPRVLDEDAGTVEFVASDSSIDSYQEIIRHDGWRFSRFSKNAPFVDSHDYSTIEKLLGQVIDWRVEKKQLVETVRYARAPGTLAEWAFKMVRDGFLRAVSVGFVPLRTIDKWGSTPQELAAAFADLGLTPEDAARVRAVYLEHEQVELSQCVIGANPNALARAYKAGTLSEADIDGFSSLFAEHSALADQKTKGPKDEKTAEPLGPLVPRPLVLFRALSAASKTATPAANSADAGQASRRTKLALLAQIQAQL